MSGVIVTMIQEINAAMFEKTVLAAEKPVVVDV
jgi:hypothetical protein